MNFINYFIDLLFPRLCITCGDSLDKNEKYICLKCLYHLPKTYFHESTDNEMEQRFWGKIPVEKAVAYFYYDKGSPYQKLIHQLKYKGDKKLGEELGKLFGAGLATSPHFGTVDVIVPVPLHHNKLKKRGYNQSEWIAKGVAEKLKKPIDTGTLYKTVENTTQIDKGVYDRWENVQGIFELKNINNLAGKHVLLIDDLFTTGATTEACVKAILQSPNAKVSIATLGVDRL